MYVVVMHEVSDPAGFWSALQDAEKGVMPEGRRLHYFLPSPDASKIACLWQAPTVDDVKALVEPAFGAVSKNDFFEVDTEKAAGLPA